MDDDDTRDPLSALEYFFAVWLLYARIFLLVLVGLIAIAWSFLAIFGLESAQESIITLETVILFSLFVSVPILPAGALTYLTYFYKRDREFRGRFDDRMTDVKNIRDKDER